MSEELFKAIIEVTADVPKVTIYRLAQFAYENPVDFASIVPFLTPYLSERAIEINPEILGQLGVAVARNSSTTSNQEEYNELHNAISTIIRGTNNG